jgi:hypothetical protein
MHAVDHCTRLLVRCHTQAMTRCGKVQQRPVWQVLQKWGDARFSMPMQLGSRKLHTTFALGAFVTPGLAEAASITPGKCYLVQKQPNAAKPDGVVINVYPHPDVAEGHVCMSPDTMRQAALAPHSQVRGVPRVRRVGPAPSLQSLLKWSACWSHNQSRLIRACLGQHEYIVCRTFITFAGLSCRCG